MPTSITAIDTETNIAHAIFIDLTLGGTTYYISSAYSEVQIGANTYTELGSLLSVAPIVDDLKTTNGDISITLSGIPSNQDYLSLILNTPIKGGNVLIRRGFFDPVNLTALPGQVYTRFQGIITNYTIDEDLDMLKGQTSITVTVNCASLNSLLENKICGQRTNPSDRRRFYPDDISFDRVPLLQNTSFDFGRKYSGGTGYVRPGGTITSRPNPGLGGG